MFNPTEVKWVFFLFLVRKFWRNVKWCENVIGENEVRFDFELCMKLLLATLPNYPFTSSMFFALPFHFPICLNPPFCRYTKKINNVRLCPSSSIIIIIHSLSLCVVYLLQIKIKISRDNNLTSTILYNLPFSRTPHKECKLDEWRSTTSCRPQLKHYILLRVATTI